MTDTKKTLLAFAQNNRQTIIFGVCFLLTLLPALSSYGITIGPEYDPEEYKKYCNIEDFTNKYDGPNAGCWSCSIIHLMMKIMVTTASVIVNATITLGKTILLWGSAVWLAAYFLKSVTAFTAQDPAKNLDAIIVFMFKVTIVYLLIYDGGFAYMVDKVVNPLLQIGMDIGTDFLNASIF